MANRAYLYSSHQSDAWDRPNKAYYDSRWTIPLAWFFFYRPNDVRMVDVYNWQEVKFSANKETALDLFAAREPLLMSLVEGRISRDTVAEVMTTVQNWPGPFLLMDPEEVIGGLSENPLVHTKPFVRILTLLALRDGPPDLVREAIRNYVGNFSPEPDRCLCQIIGDTYW